MRLELRAAPFWSAHVLNLVASGSLGFAAAVAILYSRFGFDLARVPPRVWPLVALLGAFPVATVLGRLVLRPRAIPVEFDAEQLALPRSRLSRRQTRVGYADVFSLHTAGSRWPRLLLGVHGRLPIALRRDAFRDPDGAGHFEAELRRRVAALPDGAARLAALDRRRRVAERGRSVRPLASAAAVGVVAVASVAAWVVCPNPVDFVRAAANVPLRVRAGELDRLASANLVHANALHLYGNAVALLALGFVLERLLGRARLLLVLLASALGGTALSALLSGHLASVGASTAVYGLVGVVAYLNLARRDELPVPLRVPLWWALALLALEVGVALALPVDVAGHAGGLATGLALAATLTRGSDLAELPAQPSRRAAAAAAALLALFAAAALTAAERARAGRLEDTLAFSAWVLEQRNARPELSNAAAWTLATSASAEASQLRAAVAGVERAAGAHPGNVALKDTLATALYRSGELDRAIELERQALAEKPSRFYASQLARFERARLRRDGVLALGADAADGPRLALGKDDAGRRQIVADLAPDAHPRGLVAHALVSSRGLLVGHVELRVGPGVREPRVCFGEALDAVARIPEDAVFELALVDASGRGLVDREGGPVRDGAWHWGVWSMDPRAEALP